MNAKYETIENASLNDVQPGDYVVWEYAREVGGVTEKDSRAGVAAYRSGRGDWHTESDARITWGEYEGVTITIRRTTQELPTKPGTVIVPADGHEYIEAVDHGKRCYAVEAVCGHGGRLAAVWRHGAEEVPALEAECLTPGTWKVEAK